MSYTPTSWRDGDVITADRMNHLEQGVKNEQIGPPGATGPAGADGKDGMPGKDGYSPTVTVTDIPGGHRVTITDVSGPNSFDVMDGEDGAGGGSTAGVTSFNGRDGAVTPQKGDYTADMVGAATLAQVTDAIQTAVLDSWEGTY